MNELPCYNEDVLEIIDVEEYLRLELVKLLNGE
jgi:hypothetical protein